MAGYGWSMNVYSSVIRLSFTTTKSWPETTAGASGGDQCPGDSGDVTQGGGLGSDGECQTLGGPDQRSNSLDDRLSPGGGVLGVVEHRVRVIHGLDEFASFRVVVRVEYLDDVAACQLCGSAAIHGVPLGLVVGVRCAGAPGPSIAEST